MPAEAPTIVAPAKPAPAPKPGAPTAFPASTGEIHVSAPSKPAGQAAAPKKADSPKGRLFAELEKKAGGKAAESAPAPKEEAPAGARAGERPVEGEPAAQPGEAAAQPEAKPGENKTKPWKLVEEYKGRAAKAEARVQELEKAQLNGDERKSLEERMTKLDARNKELEQYLTYVDYSQTEEFKNKYQQPYEKAWGRAMDDLKELTVPDGNGGERQIVASDMLQIINSPLAKARQIAQEVFGDFADDVMAHRKEIRALYDAQAAALEDAKKNGQERIKQAQEEAKRGNETLQRTIAETWKAENDAVLKNEKIAGLFQPREGDEKWNDALQKGYALVDAAFAVNPADPKLSAEERTLAIRRHAAVRNRAAAWGALKSEVDRLTAALKTAEEELTQYKGSEPPVSGGAKTNPPGDPGGSPKEKMFAELRKRAK